MKVGETGEGAWVTGVGRSVQREGTQEAEMKAGEGVGVLIALKCSGLFACLPLL